MLHRLILALALVLPAGCSGVPNATPLIVYVTPAPPSPPTRSASPTAAPSTPTPAAASPRYQGSEDLRVGDCFDPVFDWDDDYLIAGVLHECDEPHQAEAFAVESLHGPPGAPWPGVAAIERQVLELCDPAFEEYVAVDPEESRHGSYVWVVPLEESWELGDRSVLCAVESLRGRSLDESVRGSRR